MGSLMILLAMAGVHFAAQYIQFPHRAEGERN